MALADLRWTRFVDTDYRCPCCGKPAQGVMDLAYDHPDAWPHLSYRKNGGTVMAGDDVLMADFCSIGDQFFLRGLLPLPISGTGASFAFGPWARVPDVTFRAYHAAFGTNEEASLGARSGTLANELPGFPTSTGLAIEIRFLGGSSRPQFLVTDPSDLGKAQGSGISFDRLLDIYATFGHDLRPHLGEP